MKPRYRYLLPVVCALAVMAAAETRLAADGGLDGQGWPEQSTWGAARPATTQTSTKVPAQKPDSSGWPDAAAAAPPGRPAQPVITAAPKPVSARKASSPRAASAATVKAPAAAPAEVSIEPSVAPHAEATATPSATLPSPTPAPAAVTAPAPVPAAAIDGAAAAAILGELQDQRAQIARLLQVLDQHRTLIDQQRTALEMLQQKPTAVPGPAAAGAPAPAPAAAAVSSPAPAAAPAPIRLPDVVAQTEKKVPPNVDVGFGRMKFNGLLQGWYSAGDSSYINSFRMRRIEIKLSGELAPKAKWTVMLDPAKSLTINNTYTTVNGVKVVGSTSVSQASRLVQDAFFTLDYVKGVQIAVGQFKIPLGLEGNQSSGALDTVERALFLTDKGRGAGYGDARDVGITVRGKPAPFLEYQAGVFNGLGDSQNDVAKINDKAFVGRVLLRPSFVKGLQFGVSGAWAAMPGTPGAARHRKGAELLWANRVATVKSEYMAGDDAGVTRGGYYVHIGYKVLPRLELIARHDAWDPNTSLEHTGAVATERDYIGGFTYYLLQHTVKFQVNFMRKTFAGDLLPARTLILGNMQTSW